MSRQPPRRLEGREASDGLVQLWRFRWLIGALLLVVLIISFVVVQAFEPETLEPGQQEVRAMKADPVVTFRAPGTTLRDQEEHAAQRDPLGEGISTSSIRQTFEMTGEPGDAIEGYRRFADASGWRLVAEGCSRVERATAAVFSKRFAGFDATLVVHAQLDRDRGLDARYGEPARKGLQVDMNAVTAGLHALSVDAGLHRTDVQCLRDIDPSDADLQPPPAPSPDVGELCSRIPVPAVASIVPDVTGVELQREVGECWLVDASGRPLFTIAAAREPAAYYQDRRLVAAQEEPKIILFSPRGMKDPELARAVWVGAAGGAYVVGGGAGLSTNDTAAPLFSVASLIISIVER
ncbi:MAG: hypothetical protein LC808_27820 [Actinobacteria bacterium]|nr:hypothetical protein [Actinomycetota bacterium]